MSTGTNDWLVTEICAALEHDKGINLHTSSRIKVSVSDRRVILDGGVGDISEKRTAANLVRATVGDEYTVDDRLRVGSSNIGDAALRDKVARVLGSEPIFSEFTVCIGVDGETDFLRDRRAESSDIIKATVEDGVVTLTGQVYSLTHRRMAEVLLWWVDGCQRVDNLLEIVPAERDTDEELTDAVRMALEKDPLIDATQVQVETTGGVVELTGQLPSDEKKRIAARDAWAVADVWQVYNRIDVGHGLASGG